MNIVLTGHRGYIGRVVMEKLLADGHDVVGVDLQEGQDYGDVILDKGVSRTLVHLGAYTSVPESEVDPQKYWENNINKMKLFLDNNDFDRIIFASTNAVYDDEGLERPLSTYGWTKLIGESLVQQKHTNHLILRFANPVGIDLDIHTDDSLLESAYPNVALAIAKCKVAETAFTLHNLEGMSRDFFPVDQIASVIADQVTLTGQTGVHDLGTGRCLDVMDLLNRACNAYEVPVELIDPPAGTAAGIVVDIPPFISRHALSYDDTSFINQIGTYIDYVHEHTK